MGKWVGNCAGNQAALSIRALAAALSAAQVRAEVQLHCSILQINGREQNLGYIYHQVYIYKYIYIYIYISHCSPLPARSARGWALWAVCVGRISDI